MKSYFIAGALLLSVSPVTASEISVYTRPIVSHETGIAQAHLNNWTAALVANPVAPAGHGQAVITNFSEVTTPDVIVDGTSSNTSVFYNLDFTVPLEKVGVWRFRFQLDFGHGGAIFVDGKPVITSDANLDGEFLQFSRRLRSGVHNIKIYGQEGCCSGGNFGWFSATHRSIHKLRAD